MGERRRGARRAVGALAAAAVVAACAERVSTADTFPSASARAMLVTTRDLPFGVRRGRLPSAVAPSAASGRRAAACVPGTRTYWGMTSPAFLDDAERAVLSIVWIESSAAGARRAMADIAGEATIRCVARDVYGPRSVTPPVVRPMRFAGVGDDSAGWRVILDDRVSGARIYLDQAYVRVGRFVVQVVFVTSVDRFTPDEEDQLVRALVERAPG